MANNPYIQFFLVIKLLTFAISASKRGEELLNKFFIYAEDITPSPRCMKGWRILEMTALASPLDQKSILRTRIQVIEGS